MRTAAYCRVSTGSDEQLNSLKNQSEFFVSYSQKHGYDLVKIYADRGISGKSALKRPQFMQMLEESRENKFDMLLVKDISRFARNTVDFLNGIRELKSNGVEVRFLSSNQTVLGESEFVITLFAALAQEESCNLSKRIIFGKLQGAKHGRPAACVYGYNHGKNYDFRINPEEAAVVRRIFEMYCEQGFGIRKIANCLNSLGICSKKGKKWQFKTVRRILSNPLYIGNIVNNKSSTADFLSGRRVPISEEDYIINHNESYRIISDEVYSKAQEILLSKNAVTHRSC
ncbi:MAG: recombinase family protein [Clostridia bacterium]|nr:recombinase family protein [Clostridia bacterium]